MGINALGFLGRVFLMVLVALFGVGTGSVFPAKGCTIFVLTDGGRTLFFNNEDWSNPRSRIWFVPAPDGFYSCAYVGFDNNGAEGGMNSVGLAFDWVAGFKEKWKPYESMQPVGGRTSERMLESCATVDEAIRFYETYREPQFARAKILVADKTGASAIIGARDGKLDIQRANHSRGFGYGRRTLETMLKPTTPPDLDSGLEILRACEQKGQYATKYSSIFNLKEGEITLALPGGDQPVKLNLVEELKRGPHYYDLPEIRSQMTAQPKAALSNMRSYLREYTAVPNKHPELTEKVVAITRRCADGKIRRQDFTPELWKRISPERRNIRADLQAFGQLKGAAVVGDSEPKAEGGYRYKLEFKNAWVVEDYMFNLEGRISSLRTIGVEWKHPLPQ